MTDHRWTDTLRDAVLVLAVLVLVSLVGEGIIWVLSHVLV